MTPPENSHRALEILSGHFKVIIDFMKHLMTLSVGIIVVIATVHDRLSKGAKMLWLLPLSTVCLFACVAFALRVCFDLMYNDRNLIEIRVFALSGNITKEQAESVRKGQALTEKRDKQLGRFLVLVNLAFGAGVVGIAIFVLRNALPI